MNIVIQKFGGTSVSDMSKRSMVTKKIKNSIKKGKSPVVVVSAMGRLGEPYSTDSLVMLVKENNRHISLRELDLIMSVGEIISSVLMVDTLNSIGVDAWAFTGGQAGIITDKNFGEANILDVRPDLVIDCINRGIVPVVAGFQGVAEDGEITTLGRGGSDTTAAVLAKALFAEQIEIYTDVDGIMTADPRIVPNARKLDSLSYSETLEIADQGAKVIHPGAIVVAMKQQIPIVIKNTASDTPGTIISTRISERKNKCPATSIVHIKGRAQIRFECSNIKRQLHLLKLLADEGISLDIINIFPDHMLFSIDQLVLRKVKEILETESTTYVITENLSKISVVGEQMKGVPGVMFRIIKLLNDKNIKILQTSDSHTTISCLVKEQDIKKAISILHEGFNLHKS
ncbi:MAG TPA: aspartate kinase [Bacillota bacterium]|nr:aspartate kinase [Bacillota bacterium]